MRTDHRIIFLLLGLLINVLGVVRHSMVLLCTSVVIFATYWLTKGR